MSTFMLKQTSAVLALATGLALSGPVIADPAKFDGTWSVQLVAGGGLCGSGASQTLTVRDGSVRASGSGVSVSGQVGAICVAVVCTGGIIYTTLLPRLAPGVTVTSLSGKAVDRVRHRRDRSGADEPAPEGPIPPADGRY